jgi:hypothetical protein
MVSRREPLISQIIFTFFTFCKLDTRLESRMQAEMYLFYSYIRVSVNKFHIYAFSDAEQRPMDAKALSLQVTRDGNYNYNRN